MKKLFLLIVCFVTTTGKVCAEPSSTMSLLAKSFPTEYSTIEGYRQYYVGKRFYAVDNNVFLYGDQPTTISLHVPIVNTLGLPKEDGARSKIKPREFVYNTLTSILYNPMVTEIEVRTIYGATYGHRYSNIKIQPKVAGEYFTVKDVISADFLIAQMKSSIRDDNELGELTADLYKKPASNQLLPRTYFSQMGWGFLLKSPKQYPVFVLESSAGQILYWPFLADRFGSFLLEESLRIITENWIGKQFYTERGIVVTTNRRDLHGRLIVGSIASRAGTFRVTGICSIAESVFDDSRARSVELPQQNSTYRSIFELGKMVKDQREMERQKTQQIMACSIDATAPIVERTTLGLQMEGNGFSKSISLAEFLSEMQSERYMEYSTYEEKVKAIAQAEAQEKAQREQEVKEEERRLNEQRNKKGKPIITDFYVAVVNGVRKEYRRPITMETVGNINVNPAETMIILTDLGRNAITRITDLKVISEIQNQQGFYTVEAGVYYKAKANGKNCVVSLSVNMAGGLPIVILSIGYDNGDKYTYRFSSIQR